MSATHNEAARGGYHGAILHVDLSTGTSSRIEVPAAEQHDVLGGVGLGASLLLTWGKAGQDPYDEDAPCIVALSPLVGTPLTTSAKFAVVALSPLTGRICDALASDRFAIELKRTGIDALVLTGRAPAWQTLVLDDGDVRLEDATRLAGCSTEEAEADLREQHGAAFRYFGIGVAAERGVRFATLSGDGRHAGRGGLGAVWASKRLKGILARGTRPTPLADGERVLALAKSLSERALGAATTKYRALGTVANVLLLNRLGALPTRNFQQATFSGAERISGEAFHETPAPKLRKHCAACAIGCEHVFTSRSGKRVRLEYEGIFALGSLCGIEDRDVILEAASLCDELGMDVISAGGTAAFAMECHARGLLPDAPAFGDGPGLLRLLRDMATRSGALGELLADGSRRAAARIGCGAEAFACHVKGMELPGYEPRALQTLAVGLAVGSRGADHNRSGAYEADLDGRTHRTVSDPGKGALAAEAEDRAAVLDSLILCKFLRGAFDDLESEAAEMLEAVTGCHTDRHTLLRTGARITTLKKLVNVRAGWTRAEDTLPGRFLTEALPDGSVAQATLTREGLDTMIAAYYAARGWTPEGQVPAAIADALGILTADSAAWVVG